MLDPQVENIIKVQEPFKLANRKFHPDNSQSLKLHRALLSAARSWS